MKKWFFYLAVILATSSSLARAHSDEVKVEGKYVQVKEAVRLAAEQGDATAQYSLGEMFLQGDGVTQDTQEA
ncbi:MAG: sel1 repeat family protein, partial [Candidatus Nitrotoga sp.]